MSRIKQACESKIAWKKNEDSLKNIECSEKEHNEWDF